MRMHIASFVAAITAATLLAGTAGAQAPGAAAPPPPTQPAPVAPSEAPTSSGRAEVKAGTGVDKYEVTGEATTFPAGTTVVVWSLVHDAEGRVFHVWKRDGKEVWRMGLSIKSKRWSTQTKRTIPSAGAWEVEVVTEAGASLGSVSFTVS